MNTVYAESTPTDVSAYGGFIDAIGGIATGVVAIVGLNGFAPELMAGIGIIVFGAALLIQGGTLLSEYAHWLNVAPTQSASPEMLADGGLSGLFLFGVTGIVLGILALLGIASAKLAPIAIIAFGTALLLSSSAVRRLYQLQWHAGHAAGTRSQSEILAGGMSSGSAAVQMLAGLSAVVLGILAVSGAYSAALTLTALLVVGVLELLTGSVLSGLVMSFMHPAGEERTVR